MSKPFHSYTKQIVPYIPKVLVYTICSGLFIYFVNYLFHSFLSYDTNIMIKYDVANQINFPAFTICGCCLRQFVRNQSLTNISDSEYSLLQNKPVLNVLMNYTAKATELVSDCYYIANAKIPKNKTMCDKLQTVQESIFDGRKCFTFFTAIYDKRKPVPLMADMANAERSTSYIYVEIDFNDRINAYSLGSDSIQNADIVFAIHPATILPSMFDMQYIRIDPLQMYEMTFSIDYTKLLPGPFSTKCTNYSHSKSKFSCFYPVVVNLLIYTRYKFGTQLLSEY